MSLTAVVCIVFNVVMVEGVLVVVVVGAVVLVVVVVIGGVLVVKVVVVGVVATDNLSHLKKITYLTING